MKLKNQGVIVVRESGSEMVRKPQRVRIRKELLQHCVTHIPLFMTEEMKKREKVGRRANFVSLGAKLGDYRLQDPFQR